MTNATKDPLRNSAKLADAATKQALKLLKDYQKGEAEPMSAMEFCELVLREGFGLKNWGVGQRQRIVISKARKETLGKYDTKLMKAPPKAQPVELPSTTKVFKQLSNELSSKNDEKKVTIESAFDSTALEENGILHVPGVLSSSQVLDVLSHLSEVEDSNQFNWTFLRPTTGNGKHGAYATITTMPESLRNFQDDLRKTLKDKLGVDSGDKTIFLKYGIGGVNWAHQDQSSCPYQAFLLLSRPNIDFQGGNLYVSDPSSPNEGKTEGAVCHEVAFQSSGDLVVFAANDVNSHNQPYYHGMTEVLPGKNDVADSHRLAIGLLQT